MSTKKKVAAIVITTVALSALTTGVATASSKSSKNTRVSVTKSANVGNFAKGAKTEVASILAGLVAKGTITQAQADAITAALTAAETAARAAKPAMGPDHEAHLAVIASTLGIDAATIKTRLAAGETLAAIAGAKKDALIAALVADETKRIDAAVTAGKLTAAQATEIKATLTTRVTEQVNSSRPAMGPKGPMGGKGDKGRGHGPMGAKPGKSGAPTLTLPGASAA